MQTVIVCLNVCPELEVTASVCRGHGCIARSLAPKGSTETELVTNEAMREVRRWGSTDECGHARGGRAAGMAGITPWN